MKCISCEVNIDPKWSHAINQNMCPFCGKSILQDQLKALLSTLGEVMTQLQEYPEQLNDWLLSNYSYIKTDSPDLPCYVPKDMIKDLNKLLNDQEFQEKKTEIRKIKIDGKEQEVVVEKLMTDKRTQEIFDRTEIIKGMGKTSGKAPKDPNAPEAPKSISERTQYLKGVVQKIKQETEQGFIGQAHLASMIASGEVTDTTVPEVADLQAAIIGDNQLISSSIPNADIDGGDDDLPGLNVVAALARQAGSANKQSAQEKDYASLQKMHAKVASGQNDVLSHKGVFGR